jgi:hypothetical protein
VHRLDALFEIERTINGKTAEERLAVRQALSAPLMDELHAWLTEQSAIPPVTRLRCSPYGYCASGCCRSSNDSNRV